MTAAALEVAREHGEVDHWVETETPHGVEVAVVLLPNPFQPDVHIRGQVGGTSYVIRRKS